MVINIDFWFLIIFGLFVLLGAAVIRNIMEFYRHEEIPHGFGNIVAYISVLVGVFVIYFIVLFLM